MAAGVPVATALAGCLTQTPTEPAGETPAATISGVDLTVPSPVEMGVTTPVDVTVTLTESTGAEISVGLDVRHEPTAAFETVGRETVQLAAGDTRQLTFSMTPTMADQVVCRGWATVAAGGSVTTEMTANTTPATRAWGDAVELANGVAVTVANPRFRGGYPPTTEGSANRSLTAPGTQYAVVDVSITNTTTAQRPLPAREAFRLVAGQTIQSPVSVTDEATGVYPPATPIVAGGQTVTGTIGYRIESAVPQETLQVVHRSSGDAEHHSWQARWQAAAQL